MDLWEVDIRRNIPFQTNRRYLHDRVKETLGLLYATHWPNHQNESARGVRRSPFYDRLVEKGACHGVGFGWERPNWYAPMGAEAKYEYSYGRENWFEYSANEHRSVRENVALFDQTSFAKYRLQGADAMPVLNWVCSNDIDVAVGRVVYTQWLNERGGIEADLTVACLDNNYFRIISSAATRERDKFHIKKHLSDGIKLHDVTDEYCVLGIFGPKSRMLMEELSEDDFTNTNFEFASSNELWRASLEVLDFLPLSNVDYSGGIVTTDWYNDGTSADESIKITVRFLTNEIRSDGIKIIVHKKKCGIQQKCTVKKVSSALEYELQVAILKKAVIFEKEYTTKNRKKRPKKN